MHHDTKQQGQARTSMFDWFSIRIQDQLASIEHPLSVCSTRTRSMFHGSASSLTQVQLPFGNCCSSAWPLALEVAW